jgi:hypothetical protein
LQNAFEYSSRRLSSVIGANKLAFLFLVRDKIYYEELWQKFFTWQVLPSEFSIYVHTRSDFSFENTSFFYQKDISTKVPSTYRLTLMASRELYREALKDPLNAYFLLISEHCIPLHSFRAMQFSLFYTGKSVIDACTSRLESYRYVDYLSLHGVNRSIFRESSQFVALTRKHAEIFALENEYIRIFENVEIPNEHYHPTYLALIDLSNETTCSSGFTFTKFSGYSTHPAIYQDNQIVPELFEVISFVAKFSPKFLSHSLIETHLFHLSILSTWKGMISVDILDLGNALAHPFAILLRESLANRSSQ